MRIFFLSYAYERGLVADAGGFRKPWELAFALKKLGHEVLVFYPNLPGHFPLTPVASRAYPVLDRPGLRPLTAYLAMACQAVARGRRERPGVVYFRSCLSVLPLILRRVLGAKVVLEVNADTLEFLEQEGRGAISRWLWRRAEALNARGSDLIVALTPGLKQMLVARYGVPEAKVAVIPSGTDPAHFAPEAPASARQRIGLDPARPVIGFVGLFYRHQGIPTLLEALARLRRIVPELTGLIVGDGVMRRASEAQARRLGIADAVRFPGQVPYGKVPAYLNAMDLVVAPFTADRGETSPFKILDALACERPVVASNIPSVKPIAEASGAVMVVPPEDPRALADAIHALLTDPGRRGAMGRQGRQFVVAHHAWDQIAARMIAAISESASGQR